MRQHRGDSSYCEHMHNIDACNNVCSDGIVNGRCRCTQGAAGEGIEGCALMICALMIS